MVISIRYPNHRHSCDSLCFLFINCLMSLRTFYNVTAKHWKTVIIAGECIMNSYTSKLSSCKQKKAGENYARDDKLWQKLSYHNLSKPSWEEALLVVLKVAFIIGIILSPFLGEQKGGAEKSSVLSYLVLLTRFALVFTTLEKTWK